jgi:hypothetical protein
MKTYALALIGCSATKLDRAALARELYTGPLFRLALAYAELVAERVLILSAGYDVLSPSQLVDTYDAKLTALNSKAWGTRVSRRLVEEGLPENVLFLAGETYFAPLDVPGKETWHRPLSGLGIGEQKRHLKALIALDAASLAELVLSVDTQLATLAPGERVSEVAVEAEVWEHMVRVARRELRR